MNITILGSGGWGLANAVLLSKNGHNIKLWCFMESEAEQLRATGGNEKLLPGVKLPEGIEISTDISMVKGADLIVVAVPSFGVKTTGYAPVCGGATLPSFHANVPSASAEVTELSGT